MYGPIASPTSMGNEQMFGMQSGRASLSQGSHLQGSDAKMSSQHSGTPNKRQKLGELFGFHDSSDVQMSSSRENSNPLTGPQSSHWQVTSPGALSMQSPSSTQELSQQPFAPNPLYKPWAQSNAPSMRQDLNEW